MPIFRYFVFVGGALLALLFAVNFALPQTPSEPAIATASSDAPVIRIRSDRKLPERVVLDTTQPTIAPTAAQIVAVAAPQPLAKSESSSALADLATKTGVREANAQLVPAPKADAATVKKAEAKPQAKRRIAARSRPSQYAYPYGNPYGGWGRPMLVAQQPHFGPFTW